MAAGRTLVAVPWSSWLAALKLGYRTDRHIEPTVEVAVAVEQGLLQQEVQPPRQQIERGFDSARALMTALGQAVPELGH